MKTTRTNIVLRDHLVEEAMRLRDAKTKRQAIEEALETYIRMLKFQQFRKLRGKISWEGDLMKMRENKI
ncbi:MAG TPA: type II toxin-antitoxin system VapB family antitoxin [Cyclobacteriaceae bacterium]|nr:type II toxin-antitoxin system VapB family antitoxin [Cyclobacteriaceae bacterium]HRE65380.1 type II toxin-antitoxin system VapB family antitoxin [Cyclobacteriaceae bacterium]HRF34293.1 type II toxin-antitoxin system VapB family antitoxin [Cyclobacteriaceae bacterium]